MNTFNIIVVGACNYGTTSSNENNVSEWNNVLQAKHEDLCKLHNEFINIVCYDMLYKYTVTHDNIHYINSIFSLEDTSMLSKENHNIIIEFCNLFDENFVNRKNIQSKLHIFEGYKITVLSCGCGWNKGFPLECLLNIIYSENMITPCDAHKVDNFLYTISSVRCIIENGLQDVMQPYLYGLYQNMGTLKWRGSESHSYAAEQVLRDLFKVMGDNISDLFTESQQKEVHDFIQGYKHWNKLSWNLRESASEYIYGCKYS
jgi:hypothetical protein